MRQQNTIMAAKRQYNIPKFVSINRKASGTVKFTDVFHGFEKVGAVRRIFGKGTKATLAELKIRVSPRVMGYLWVDDKRGRVAIVQAYLKFGSLAHLYLDAIHELVHIRQLNEGKRLFYFPMSYVDWPTEIEAYKIAVKEARRIGMTDSEIRKYLNVFWVTPLEMRKLYKRVGV